MSLPRNDGRPTGGEGFEHFALHAEFRLHGRDEHAQPFQILANIIDCAGHFDALAVVQFSHFAGRVASDDPPLSLRVPLGERRPDVVGEPSYGFDVGLVVHGADEADDVVAIDAPG